MHYALTGATGFVGGALAASLLEDCHSVRALVRDPARSADLTGLGAELVEGDLADRDALDALCDGSDGLFHVAAWYKLGSRNPEDAWAANVTGTDAVLEAAGGAGVPRIVYTSTLAVNSDTRGRVVDETYRFTGEHLSVYDETKARAHDVAAAKAADGLPVVIVQPGLVYGPGDTSLTGAIIGDVVAGRRPPVPSGGGVCWGYIDDIARGHVLAMERGAPGESYMLAGPPATLAAGLRVAARIAGTPGPRVIPRGAVAAAATLAGVAGRVLPLSGTYAAEALRAGLATYLGNPEKAQSRLGWTCRSIDEGMASTVASLR